MVFLINLRPKARFALEVGPPQETNAAISSPASGEALPEIPRRARAFPTRSAACAPPGASGLTQAHEIGGSRRRGRPGRSNGTFARSAMAEASRWHRGGEGCS